MENAPNNQEPPDGGSDQRLVHPCLKCGKTMIEERKFPGMWSCPDYKVALNDRPPFRFKCTGSHLTDAGAEAFDAELHRQYAIRN